MKITFLTLLFSLSLSAWANTQQVQELNGILSAFEKCPKRGTCQLAGIAVESLDPNSPATRALVPAEYLESILPREGGQLLSPDSEFSQQEDSLMYVLRLQEGDWLLLFGYQENGESFEKVRILRITKSEASAQISIEGDGEVDFLQQQFSYVHIIARQFLEEVLDEHFRQQLLGQALVSIDRTEEGGIIYFQFTRSKVCGSSEEGRAFVYFCEPDEAE